MDYMRCNDDELVVIHSCLIFSFVVTALTCTHYASTISTYRAILVISKHIDAVSLTITIWALPGAKAINTLFPHLYRD